MQVANHTPSSPLVRAATWRILQRRPQRRPPRRGPPLPKAHTRCRSRAGRRASARSVASASCLPAGPRSANIIEQPWRGWWALTRRLRRVRRVGRSVRQARVDIQHLRSDGIEGREEVVGALDDEDILRQRIAAKVREGVGVERLRACEQTTSRQTLDFAWLWGGTRQGRCFGRVLALGLGKKGETRFGSSQQARRRWAYGWC